MVRTAKLRQEWQATLGALEKSLRKHLRIRESDMEPVGSLPEEECARPGKKVAKLKVEEDQEKVYI